MQFSSIFGSTVANDLNDDGVVRGLLGARFVHPYHGKANVAEPANSVTGTAKSPSPTVGVTSPSPGTILPSQDAAAPSAVAPATITSVTLPGHMTVNLELDANAQAAPTYFATDFQIAANMISNAIDDPITVNLSVDVSGTGGGASAAPDSGVFEPYSTVRSILASRANTPQEQAAVATLPNTTSIQGQSQVVVWSAQEKAFGELSATDPGIDGSANFASDIASGQLVGVALHELTHAMGRVPAGDSSQPEPDILDLFRFTSPGTRYFSDALPAAASYFSLDGGNTDIADYGENSDPSDFLNPPDSNRTPNDPFNEYYDTDTQQSFTPIDLEQLEALGFNVVCFASGTLIRAVRGQDHVDVAVETLAVGDRVVTAAGEQRPIRWLGHRTIDCRRHPRPREAMPVRVAAHAFGENRPARDLFLSPGHSVCIDVVGGVLIPVGRLVNGATIEQLDVDTVTYWHVELESHDILLAENLACESYIDCGTRAFFAESGVVSLGASPDAPILTTDDYCRPFRPEGALVDMVRERLCLRAADLGWRLAVEDELAALWLEVDGARIEPVRHGLLARATLPAGAREVRIRSDSAVPATIHGDKDERRLGLQLASLVIDDGLGCRREIACTDERLVDGFHPHEGTHRWTDGDARLPAELWEGCRGDFRLRLAFAGPALPRWLAAAATLVDASAMAA